MARVGVSGGDPLVFGNGHNTIPLIDANDDNSTSESPSLSPPAARTSSAVFPEASSGSHCKDSEVVVDKATTFTPNDDAGVKRNSPDQSSPSEKKKATPQIKPSGDVTRETSGDEMKNQSRDQNGSSPGKEASPSPVGCLPSMHSLPLPPPPPYSDYVPLFPSLNPVPPFTPVPYSPDGLDPRFSPLRKPLAKFPHDWGKVGRNVQPQPQQHQQEPQPPQPPPRTSTQSDAFNTLDGTQNQNHKRDTVREETTETDGPQVENIQPDHVTQEKKAKTEARREDNEKPDATQDEIGDRDTKRSTEAEDDTSSSSCGSPQRDADVSSPPSTGERSSSGESRSSGERSSSGENGPRSSGETGPRSSKKERQMPPHKKFCRRVSFNNDQTDPDNDSKNGDKNTSNDSVFAPSSKGGGGGRAGGRAVENTGTIVIENGTGQDTNTPNLVVTNSNNVDLRGQANGRVANQTNNNNNNNNVNNNINNNNNNYNNNYYKAAARGGLPKRQKSLPARGRSKSGGDVAGSRRAPSSGPLEVHLETHDEGMARCHSDPSLRRGILKKDVDGYEVIEMGGESEEEGEGGEEEEEEEEEGEETEEEAGFSKTSSTATEGESDAGEKTLPMFFVGGDSTRTSRHNSCPDEKAPLNNRLGPVGGRNLNGGGQTGLGTARKEEEVRLRHPPKSQTSMLLMNLFMILSGLYGILVVVLGAVIPLTEIFVKGEAAAFEYFYIYLYTVSIVFLGYVYVYLLRRKRLQTEFIARTLSRSVSFTRGFANSFLQRQNSDKSRQRKRMVSLDESNHHTGTFYLRLGVLGFGIGSMIHSGLNFGKFFGSITEGQCSNGASLLLKPLLHLIFTFSQLYFIFMNSKMCIHRYKVVARFGLMHMAATNICVWFRSIVVETLHEIHHHHAHNDDHSDHDVMAHIAADHHGSGSGSGGTAHASLEDVVSSVAGAGAERGAGDTESVTVSLGRKLLAAAVSVNGSRGDNSAGLMELRCSWDNMMGRAVDSAGPYLYPCTIEYSLMCAGILYVMWTNVGTRPRRRQTSSLGEDDEDDWLDAEGRHQRMSVDCTSSSRGLFLGIFLTVLAIISIIAFYVMSGQPHLKPQALLLTHLSETLIYLVTTFALVMATVKMRHLTFHSDHKSDLEETLIIIAYTGLLAFNIFGLIAAILMAPQEGATLTIVSNFTMVLQSALQTIFMLAGDRMSASNTTQERKKPGREYVTFLLLCNFAMWIINTFETQKPEHNPLQVEFYGPEAWAIFSHISVPLGIYYRFHSTVCLSNIWKNAWKSRKHH